MGYAIPSLIIPTANPRKFSTKKATNNAAALEADSAAEAKQDNSVKILSITMFIVSAIIGPAFGVIAAEKYNHDSGESKINSRAQDDENAPETGKEFAASSAHLPDIDALLTAAEPGNRWSGGAAASGTDRNRSLRALVRQMADLNDGAHTTVQTQANQVDRGRTDLGNTLNELGFAIPLAQSLYFSGAAGPALSYNFQLAVSSFAMDNSVNTANETHSNARQNAARCNTLKPRIRSDVCRPADRHELQPVAVAGD